MTSDTLAAVLWDMDGTIVDSEPLWLQAELAMLGRYGIEMTPEIHDGLVGTGLWEAAEGFRRLGVPMSADDIVAEWVRSVAQAMAVSPPDWRPGARELLASLRERGIPCALVTMSVRSLAEAIAELLPPGTFDAIVAGDEVDHEKPHPQPYLLGAAALGVAPERCVAIEDSPTGLRSATAAGAVAIGVPNLLPLDQAPASAVLPTLEGVRADEIIDHYHRSRGGRPTRASDRAAEEASL